MQKGKVCEIYISHTIVWVINEYYEKHASQTDISWLDLIAASIRAYNSLSPLTHLCQVWDQYWLCCGLPMVCKALLFLATPLLIKVEISRLKPQKKVKISNIYTSRFVRSFMLVNGVLFVVTPFPNKILLKKTKSRTSTILVELYICLLKQVYMCFQAIGKAPRPPLRS